MEDLDVNGDDVNLADGPVVLETAPQPVYRMELTLIQVSLAEANSNMVP